MISKRSLFRATATGVRRLAGWLGMHIGGMGDDQVRRLVWWRLSR